MENRKLLKIHEQKWPEGTKPLVTVRCITYNHAKYIEDAINSFLTQNTNFPVEICVYDDASNDGTSEILKEYQSKYPSIIKLSIAKENTFNNPSRGKIMMEFDKSFQGDYVAMCEGDDYWISDTKLQSQVNLMLQYPMLKLVGGRALIKSNDRETSVEPSEGIDLKLLDSHNFFKGIWLHTCTRLICREFLINFKESVDPDFHYDFGFVLFIMRAVMMNKAKISSVNDVVSVYRIHENGLWSSMPPDERKRENLAILYYFRKKSKLSPEFLQYVDAQISFIESN